MLTEVLGYPKTDPESAAATLRLKRSISIKSDCEAPPSQVTVWPRQPQVIKSVKIQLLSAKHIYTALFPHARTHASYLCACLALTVNNSCIYCPIFFKMYTLIIIAILRYHIKNHYICFIRFVFIQFLIRSLFEKKESRISDFRLTFDR